MEQLETHARLDLLHDGAFAVVVYLNKALADNTQTSESEPKTKHMSRIAGYLVLTVKRYCLQRVCSNTLCGHHQALTGSNREAA